MFYKMFYVQVSEVAHRPFVDFKQYINHITDTVW